MEMLPTVISCARHRSKIYLCIFVMSTPILSLSIPYRRLLPVRWSLHRVVWDRWRECAASLLKFAKQTNTPVLLVGHINKEGSIAGPKVLEHIVDTVLQFEGDRHYLYRILRSIKNRFGSTSELGIYEMRQNGLREVSNPSEMLLTQNHEGLSGVAIAVTIEGIRPFLIETQALVSTAAYGTPQRSATRIRPAANEYVTCRFGKEGRVKLAQKTFFSILPEA